MATVSPKNILVAPLDWGLGHTTRCVPIIRHLLLLGHKPVVAGNAAQRAFIASTFGSALPTVHLDGYNVTYSAWNRIAQAGLLAQLPRMAATIGREHSWLQQQAKELQLHGVIADNRYGLHHSHVPSVIITHQLRVLTGMGAPADAAVQRLHYRLLGRFGCTWVPDAKEGNSLGGILSHPRQLPAQVQYIGPLSRFEPDEIMPAADAPLMILLSGPEPQRTGLARILWQQAVRHTAKVTFIEGTDTAAKPDSIPPHISYYKRLAGHELEPLLRAAGMIICRSGYSTIMDLAAMHKKAIFIPTPGQTEQQYLAAMLQEQGLFPAMPQRGFELAAALANAATFPYRSPAIQDNYGDHKKVVEDWVATL